MKVSIIIPTYNNATMLATTLLAFGEVYFPAETELIIVDNNSTDQTKETVNSFSDRLPVRYVFEPNQGVSAAKNSGLSIASGELLIFTDDDVRPVSTWISTYLSAYESNPKGFFWGGPVVSEFEGSMPDKRLLRLAPFSVRGLDLGERVRTLNDNEWFIGANWACPSEAISRVGAFNPAIGPYPGATVVLVGEETEMQSRLCGEGYKPLYIPSASLRHVVPERKCTLSHVASRAEASGRFTRTNAPAVHGWKTLRGIPLWRYRRCIETWVRAWFKRVAGLDWYSDYISYRSDKGFLLGSPERTCKDQN